MNILIIGGAGYVGSVLTEYYVEKGYNVIVLDLLKRGDSGIVHLYSKPNFTLLQEDFITCRLGHILAKYHIDIVLHLAAIVGDPECKKHHDLATRINIEGVKWLVHHCNHADHVKKLFFASTCSVYGCNKNVCTEETRLNPLSHYAYTKLKAEEIIRKESKQGISFRFGTMYGWSKCMRYDLVVNLLTKIALEKNEFKIFDGTQYRAFIHPLEVAVFWDSLFEKDLSNYTGEVFNLVSENLSMLELGQLLERTLPFTLMNQVPEMEDHRSYICRCFKAHSQLGFSPKIRVRDGIQQIAYYLENVKEYTDIHSILFSVSL